MSRDTSESHPGRPLGQFGRVKRVPGVGRCGRSEADRDPYLVLRGLSDAPYRLPRPTNGEASNAIHRTSPFTHSAKFVPKILHVRVRIVCSDLIRQANRTKPEGNKLRIAKRKSASLARDTMTRARLRRVR